MANIEFQKSTITKYRKGDVLDPFVSVSEPKKVINNQVQLSEIPYFHHKVQVSGGYTEVLSFYRDDLDPEDYTVDYNEGICYFHSEANGKTLTFTYTGMGNHYISSSRVWTRENNGEVVTTLQDVLDAGANTYVYKGDWSASTPYVLNNTVRYNSETYICVANNTGQSPLNAVYWQKIAASGSIASVASTTGDMTVQNPTTAPALTIITTTNGGVEPNKISKTNANGRVGDSEKLTGKVPSTSATADTIVQRTSTGTIKGATSVAADDLTRKDFVETLVNTEASKKVPLGTSNNEIANLFTMLNEVDNRNIIVNRDSKGVITSIDELGNNWIPKFPSWSRHMNTTVLNDYSLRLTATGSGQDSYIFFDVLPSTTYTFKVQYTGLGLYKPYLSFRQLDSNVTQVAFLDAVPTTDGEFTGTFTTTATTVRIKLVATSNGSGTFTFTNPVMEQGSTIPTFSPRILRCTTINRATNGNINSVVQVCNGKTITYTLNRNAQQKISSITKTVV